MNRVVPCLGAIASPDAPPHAAPLYEWPHTSEASPLPVRCAELGGGGAAAHQRLPFAGQRAVGAAYFVLRDAPAVEVSARGAAGDGVGAHRLDECIAQRPARARLGNARCGRALVALYLALAPLQVAAAHGTICQGVGAGAG